jgi:hypothetical protein
MVKQVVFKILKILIRNPEGGGAEKLRDLGVNGRFRVKKALKAC